MPICVHTIEIHELLNRVVSFIVLEVSFDTGTILNFWLMDLGCPLLGVLSSVVVYDVSQLLCALTFMGGGG